MHFEMHLHFPRLNAWYGSRNFVFCYGSGYCRYRQIRFRLLWQHMNFECFKKVFNAISKTQTGHLQGSFACCSGHFIRDIFPWTINYNIIFICLKQTWKADISKISESYSNDCISRKMKNVNHYGISMER